MGHEIVPYLTDLQGGCQLVSPVLR